MAELSPSAAILVAFRERYKETLILLALRERYDETLRPGPFVGRWQAACLAAALEALADQVVPEGGCEAPDCCLAVAESIRSDILAIAAELRGGQADG